MKVIIVGLGIQGRKRMKLLGKRVVFSVDPKTGDADYREIYEVPLNAYDAAFLCVPDNEKTNLIEFCIRNKKHVLVEKPLLMNDSNELINIQNRASDAGVVIYTAYNHRFEPHIKTIQKILGSKQLGKLYSINLSYGNGTSQLVKSNEWRDSGSGVITDLAPHLLDMLDFWIGRYALDGLNVKARSFETKAPDFAVITADYSGIAIKMDVSWCCWKNTFTCDIFGEKGSIHLSSLCKWGPSILTTRERIMPSGPPIERHEELLATDPTWHSEHQSFFALIGGGFKTDLRKDIWISGLLNEINSRL
jgi:scyllo-inositol 2-dehydrogenase (NADP+)